MRHTPGLIHELTPLRDRLGVFRDRAHAGQVLADMLARYRHSDSLVLGIPAGGIPVAAQIARRLQLPLDVAVVSKITLPWNSESGFGAVAFDGSVHLNAELVPHLHLSAADINDSVAKTTAKVKGRVERLCGRRPRPRLTGRTIILVDDGLASGFTMRVAIETLSKRRTDHIIVAVPTAHTRAAEKIRPHVAELYCANLRGGWSFAVADAYQLWYDVEDAEVSRLLERCARESTATTEQG
ncbi:MAG: phosphoribosyltransferase [Acidiferrobacterales bacterium]